MQEKGENVDGEKGRRGKNGGQARGRCGMREVGGSKGEKGPLWGGAGLEMKSPNSRHAAAAAGC